LNELKEKSQKGQKPVTSSKEEEKKRRRRRGQSRANHMGKELRCSWERLREQLENLGIFKGTLRLHVTNTLGTKKKN
jgi:hypothetical protein